MFYTRDFLNSIAEKCRKDYCRTDDEKAGSDQREYVLGYSVLARVHLDIYLECGYDRKSSCNRVNDVLDIEQVLYFAFNYIDNQRYVNLQKGKCSQNETRIVLSISMEKDAFNYLRIA